jgi:hypothetical protein
MPEALAKVTAFVTRQSQIGQGLELLVFQHPFIPKPSLVAGQDLWLNFVYSPLMPA